MSHEPDEHQHRPQVADSQLAAGALAAAESYVARSTGSSGSGNGGGTEFTTSFGALCEWAEVNGFIHPDSNFDFFRRPPDGHGQEIQGWFEESTNRWFKATYENRFGLAWGRDGSATAAEYLRRLLLQNAYFGDDIRLEAIVNCCGKMRVLTSQPHIAGGPASYEAIQSWFESIGFAKIATNGRVAWYRWRENLLVADAHEGNVIATAGGELVPIDLNLVQPEQDLLEWARGAASTKAAPLP